MPLPSLSDTGPSLLDKSTAKPGSVDMSIFDKKHEEHAASKSQGAVNSKYLEECRRDNPPHQANSQRQPTVVLTDCKITTPSDQLMVNHAFEMEVTVNANNGASPNPVFFRVFCQHGDSQPVDQSVSIQGARCDGNSKVTGKGTLLSPKGKMPYGSKAKYHVIAEHSQSAEKAKSPQIEVELDKPPAPVAIWNLSGTFFESSTSFLLPKAKNKMQELINMISAFPNAKIAIFGHCNSEADELSNIKLSLRRSQSLYGLLSQNVAVWQTLLHDERWGPEFLWEMHDFIVNECDNSSAIAPNSIFNTIKLYLSSISRTSISPENFAGQSCDNKHSMICIGCGRANLLHELPADINKEHPEYSNLEIQQAEERITVILFSTSNTGGKIGRFPCPSSADSTERCVNYQDMISHETEKHQTDNKCTNANRFKCEFYSKIAKNEKPSINSKIEHFLAPQISASGIPFQIFNRNSAVVLPQLSEAKTFAEAANSFIEMISLSILEHQNSALSVMIGQVPEDDQNLLPLLKDARNQIIEALIIGDKAQFTNICMDFHTDTDIHAIKQLLVDSFDDRQNKQNGLWGHLYDIYDAMFLVNLAQSNKIRSALRVIRSEYENWLHRAVSERNIKSTGEISPMMNHLIWTEIYI